MMDDVDDDDDDIEPLMLKKRQPPAPGSDPPIRKVRKGRDTSHDRRNTFRSTCFVTDEVPEVFID